MGVAMSRASTPSAGRELRFDHSIVRLERGPAGILAKIDHDERGLEYAGPLDRGTVRALRQVAGGGQW